MRISLLLTAVLALSGCADQLVPDGRLRFNTAGVLGADESAVTISNRRSALTDTYYTATTPHGVFACSMNGGNILTAGLINTPVCNRL